MAVTDWRSPSVVKANLDAHLRGEIERLAREGDRSVASEVRRAIREYVRKHGSEQQEQVP
jgi:hypothetical protein